MSNPQEPAPPHIVPFPTRDVQTASPIPAGAHSAGDRLLAITPLPESDTPEAAIIRHLRVTQLGASSGAFYPNTPTELAPLAASRLGISAMEIMLQTAGEYEPAFISELGRNAKSAGIDVFSMHLMSSLHPFLDTYPRRIEEAHALFQRALDGAVSLGATVLVWHGPTKLDVESEAGWERFIDLTQVLASACIEAGVTLGIENVSYGALSQVRDIAKFATRLTELGPRRGVGFVFDPFQAAEAGANPYMMLVSMGNRIANVHVSDAVPGDTRIRHLLPGDGELQWPAIIRAIAGTGYSGPLMIEGPLGRDPQGMTRVRRTLEPLMRSVFPFDPDAPGGDVDGATRPPPGVLRGIELFNARAFYEQHEEIEAEWHAERRPIRRLYQGILQIGVGFHHACGGNHPGAVSLLKDGIAKVSEFLPEALGIDTHRLVVEATACLEALGAAGPHAIGSFDQATIPMIRMVNEGRHVDRHEG